MIFFIIVTIIVVTIIWFISDKNNIQYAAKPKLNPPTSGSGNKGNKGSSGSNKGSSGSSGSNKGSSGSSGSNKGNKGVGNKGNKGVGNKGVGNKGGSGGNKGSSGGNKGVGNKGSSGGSSSGQLKFKNTSNQAPTYDRLQKALAAYVKYNKSGKVDPSSSYADLVNKGYLQFQNGKWTSYLQPSGRPPVIGGGNQGGSNQGGNQGGSNQGSSNQGSSNQGVVKPKGQLSGGLANQAWDDYGNKYAKNTTVGNSKVVMTDTRNNQFDSNPQKVAEYNQQLISQGKIPMAYMNTGFVDPLKDVGNDKYFTKLYKDLNAAGVLSGTEGSGHWKENVINGKTILNNPSALNKVKAAYTDFIKGMKSLGYKAINVDNLDFYNKGINSQLSKSDQQKLGQMWQSTVSDLIHQQNMYAVAKNAPELVTTPGSTYVKNWDAIVTENAKTKGWDDTAAYKQFADAGKPVWNFQTKTNYSSQDLPNWMDSYSVGQGKQGWWENN